MELLYTNTPSYSVNPLVQTGGVSVEDVFQILYLTFGILGLFGNGLVLLVMVRVRSLRTITNFFITNQSIIDFVTSIFVLIFKYNPTVIDFSNQGYNFWTIFVCKFWHSKYIFWAMMGASTNNLIVITIERWMAVVFPIVYRNRVTRKTASICAVLPWILGFMFHLHKPASRHFEDGVCFSSFGNRAIQAVVGIFLFVVKLLLPVFIMVIVYTSILKKLKPILTNQKVKNLSRSTTMLNTDTNLSLVSKLAIDSNVQTSNDTVVDLGKFSSANTVTNFTSHSKTSQQSKIRMNILKTLFLVTILFVICWTPISIVFLIYNLGGKINPTSTIYNLFVLLAYVNIWINPVVYTFKYRKFQEGLRKTFGFTGKIKAKVSAS
ncbi:Alpha-1A adrenergic receptor [Holothuria leucospilota]|uniref:Alpha-1A adrenergic receptor n=1 Tax=Holothuria leucospilota TaxID=206669 RepID=A0A9Q1CIT4_HOLLE|nr:Alpha-1A adrenergic receptor [Holothuria leucospilota]